MFALVWQTKTAMALRLPKRNYVRGRLRAFVFTSPDTPQVYLEWRQLVVKHAVSGVQVHDARLVAGMKAHGITNCC